MKQNSFFERLNQIFDHSQNTIDNTIQELDKISKEKGLPTSNDFKEKFDKEVNVKK